MPRRPRAGVFLLGAFLTVAGFSATLSFTSASASGFFSAIFFTPGFLGLASAFFAVAFLTAALLTAGFFAAAFLGAAFFGAAFFAAAFFGAAFFFTVPASEAVLRELDASLASDFEPLLLPLPVSGDGGAEGAGGVPGGVAGGGDAGGGRSSSEPANLAIRAPKAI